VPVFYGTDRNRVKQEGRFGYANDRAKRLEMGRALVSVPLDHKVPNIERPRAWTIPYVGTFQLEKEDPNRHFTVRELKSLSKTELLALVKQRLSDSRTFRNQSIVFIHGYNTSFDDSLFRTAQISYDLQFDGAAYTYSWPSGGGLASYIYDRDSAQGAERYLYEFLQMVQNETGSSSINIIAHSMGNQMLLQVLRTLKLRAPAAVSRINQIILASPDVDRDAFEAIAAEITGVARGITLYAAANDRALEASRLVAGNKPRAGDVPDGGPVIVAGIDSIDITRLSTSYLAIHHSGYAEHTDLLTDIGQIIRNGTRPWSGRLKAYKPVNVPSGTYWRYEK
jgi:esterase/lipase superfamily enzyme